MALFAVTVYHDERVVVVAEQKPHCSDEEVSCGGQVVWCGMCACVRVHVCVCVCVCVCACMHVWCGVCMCMCEAFLPSLLAQAFKWMNGVLPAVEAIHGVRGARGEGQRGEKGWLKE